MWVWGSLAVLVLGSATLVVVRAWARRHDLAAHHRHWANLNLMRAFTGVCALAVYLVLYPVVADQTTSWPTTMLATLYATWQVFSLNIDLFATVDTLRQATGLPAQLAAGYTTALFAIAPAAAIGFVLTFVSSASARLRYWWRRRHDVTVFSQLNARSLALAASLRQQDRSAPLVFTAVDPGDDRDWLAQARRLGAICFPFDATALPPARPGARQRFFLISDDPTRNLNQALSLVHHPVYAQRAGCDVYLFAHGAPAELALRHHGTALRIRRIDPGRSLVLDWLWQAGTQPGGAADLFVNAVPDGPHQVISAAILGLGDIGQEMLRALTWYCQMDTPGGVYRLRLHAFDPDPGAAARFAARYPGLTNRPPDDPGPRQDANLELAIHGGIDEPGLVAALADLDPLTFVFICWGDDATNLDLALQLRRTLARLGRHPQIVARHTDAASLGGAAITGPPHHITLIGDTAALYSHTGIIASPMEANALACHLSWGTREQLAWQQSIETFWSSDYHYRSSIAVPIHWRARRQLDIPGARRAPQERTPAERDALRRLEHARWNAFLRSEGFVWGPVRDTEVARIHPLLVAYDQLTPAQQGKDDNDAADALARLQAGLAQLDPTDPMRDQLRAFVDEVTPYVESPG